MYVFQVDAQFSNANVSRTVRFTDLLYHELNMVAAKNKISFNLLVLQCCRYALDHLEPEDRRKE